MRGNEFRMELRELVNRHGIDTELDAPDWLIAEKIESFLVTIKQFSTHAGYTPLNNMVGTILQPTTNAVCHNGQDCSSSGEVAAHGFSDS